MHVDKCLWFHRVVFEPIPDLNNWVPSICIQLGKYFLWKAETTWNWGSFTLEETSSVRTNKHKGWITECTAKLKEVLSVSPLQLCCDLVRRNSMNWWSRLAEVLDGAWCYFAGWSTVYLSCERVNFFFLIIKRWVNLSLAENWKVEKWNESQLPYECR